MHATRTKRGHTFYKEDEGITHPSIEVTTSTTAITRKPGSGKLPEQPLLSLEQPPQSPVTRKRTKVCSVLFSKLRRPYMSLKRRAIDLETHAIGNGPELPNYQVCSLPWVQALCNETRPIAALEHFTVNPAPQPMFEWL
jgi:hypothetical protein